MSLSRTHSFDENFLSLVPNYKIFLWIAQHDRKLWVGPCNNDEKVNKNYLLLNVFSILKIGAESNDGMPFLNTFPDCPRFLFPPKKVKINDVLKLIFHGQIWPSIIHSFQLFFQQFFSHDSYACLLSTTNVL
jgi:hypothetical protein